MARLGADLRGVDVDDAMRLALAVERASFDFVLSDDLVVLAALAGRTGRLGLVGAVDTDGAQPFDVARQLATLDHLCDGRAGWYVADTSAEFVGAVGEFWDSWQPDAVLADLETGVYTDPGRIRPVTHTGEQFDLRGMATLPAGPQGPPILLRDGSFAVIAVDGDADATAVAGQIDRSGTDDRFLVAPAGLEDFLASVVPLLCN